MAERPIIFSGPMVKAILAGAKSQTRRAVKPQPPPECTDFTFLPVSTETAWRSPAPPVVRHPGPLTLWVRCPYGAPGDRLWVRETWCPGEQWVDTAGYDHDPPSTIRYRADNSAIRYPNTDLQHALSTAGWSDPKRGRSPIHMPRFASRLTLEITWVRVERLHAITEDDARAEGVDAVPMADVPRRGTLHLRDDFAQLWAKVHGAGAWERNPFVWVLEFERVEASRG